MKSTATRKATGFKYLRLIAKILLTYIDKQNVNQF